MLLIAPRSVDFDSCITDEIAKLILQMCNKEWGIAYAIMTLGFRSAKPRLF